MKPSVHATALRSHSKTLNALLLNRVRFTDDGALPKDGNKQTIPAALASV